MILDECSHHMIFPVYILYDWPYNLGLAIVGLISGFAMFKIKSRFNIARTLGFGILGAIGGVTVATLLLLLVDSIKRWLLLY